MRTMLPSFRVRWHFASLALLAACGGGEPPAHTMAILDGALWMQQSAEYWAVATQTYAVAKERLDQALEDRSWTAALEQGSGYEQLPPAVVLDVDETVLQSTSYTAERIAAGDGYTLETWRDWYHTGGGKPVPGSLDFCRYAISRGVAVYFVTNNRDTLHTLVSAALRDHGYPVRDDNGNVITRSDVRDKGPRRRALAAEHRILLIFGDDGNDFATDLGNGAGADRAAAAERYGQRWGQSWFLLPNPMYGSWMNSLFEGLDAETPTERWRAKLKRLQTH